VNHWQRWLPDATAGIAVVVIGFLELNRGYYTYTWGTVTIVVGLAAAVGLSRLAPGAALVVAWLVGATQVATGSNAMLIEVLFGVVAFGCARWGGTAVVWLSGLSIPLGAASVVLWLDPDVFYRALDVAGVKVLAERAYTSNDWRVPAALMAMAVLMAPWLAGLALRFSVRSQESRRFQVVAEAERDQAEEIAQLRDQQASLARDVHDVVGHSLAVILAQAESAQYLKDADTEALKRTMDNIASSARTSLDDVRHVLSATTGGVPARAAGGDLDGLVEGVRASGHEVVSTEFGAPQPMPPELEVVAFRVLQEMLTNALKHGRRGEPVRVERHWEGELRIEVQNVVEHETEETRPLTAMTGGGQGIDGMRRRLEAVGGRLDVRRRTDPPTFTATAWVPVRAR
jgi:signal transduction histidine kinase